MSKVMRSVKNVTKGYSSTQVKVREATSNDAWGPSGTQMSEIAQLTFNGGSDFVDIMEMLDKRLNDKGKNWRHVLKALKVLDYCLHEGSIKVVSWAQANIYIIKTLREFQYMDEDGRDVGQNVRVAAKELTSLLIDEERLTAERNDRRSWKSRVTGLDEYGPPTEPSRSRPQRYQGNDENDVEYRLAIEASKAQEEEDRRKREHQPASFDDDDDLAKAIQLSKEEEDRRRKELEQASAANNASLFDDDLIQIASTQKVQPTGFNMGYQQGQPVDFFANPVDQNQIQPQPTGYMTYAYTGFQNQPTGFFQNGYGMQQPNMPDMYQQQQNMAVLQQTQPTGFNNPYALQVPSPQPEPPMPTGSNNPWATSNAGLMKPAPTGSNNPFSAPSSNTSNSPFNRPRTAQASGLGSLPEQNPIANFQSQPQTPQTQRDLSDHEQKLNALLAGGDGMDTFGNTGNLRIPAQHTAPGTFVNSAGSGINKLNADATGNNPFLRTQFTGMPSVQYPQSQAPSATGPVGYGTAQNNNPFAMRQQQSSTPQDLIQF